MILNEAQNINNHKMKINDTISKTLK